MKIEILSMQDVFNFGSLLQAYGLKKTIEELVPDATVCYLPIKPNSEDNAVADKAEDKDDFALADQLSAISGVKVPKAVEEIRTAPVLHDIVVDAPDMPDTVKKVLGIH